MKYKEYKEYMDYILDVALYSYEELDEAIKDLGNLEKVFDIFKQEVAEYKAFR